MPHNRKCLQQHGQCNQTPNRQLHKTEPRDKNESAHVATLLKINTLTVVYWPSELRGADDPQSNEPPAHGSPCAVDNSGYAQRTGTLAHVYVDVKEHTLNTRAHVRLCPFLLPQNFPALVFSARSRAVFLHACRNSCLHSPFPPKQGKGKQKHNKRIRGDYRLSEF